VVQHPGKEIGNVGAVRRMGSKNSPGNLRSSPHTSSTDDVFKSNFQALGIPTKTNCRASAQCSSPWHMMAALICLCNISIIRLKAATRGQEIPVMEASV